MSRLAFLSSLLLFSLVFVASPATAGDYYNGGYGGRYVDGGHYGHRRYGGSVWYSSDCCFSKIVRHERSVRYVRNDGGYRNGYYDRPYRNGYNGNGYYARPYYGAGYARPYYRSSYGYGGGAVYHGNGYDSYNSCAAGRVRVPDGHGGWVWSVKAGCL